MNVVPVGDSFGPRIGPKVFADVPSAAELAEARADAAGAKRSRAVMLLLVVLLLGALAASVAFIVLTRNTADADVQALKLQVENQQGQLRVASEQLSEARTEVASLTRAFATYQSLYNLERDLGNMQAAITAKIEDPVYSNLRLTDDERALIYNTTPWTAVGLSAGAWKGMIQQRLAKQIDDLVVVQAKVDGYRPPAPPATPPTICNKLTDPNCN